MRPDIVPGVLFPDDWPIIGEAAPEAETGRPVAEGLLPVNVPGAEQMKPQTSDEFKEKVFPLCGSGTTIPMTRTGR